MGFKPIKRLLYTWFNNYYTLFGLSELMGYIYTVWGWDWSMAFYELHTGDIIIIPSFCWCMEYSELNNNSIGGLCMACENTL